MRPFLSLIIYALLFCLAIFAGSYLFEKEGYVLLGYGPYYIEGTILGVAVRVIVLLVILKLLKWLVLRLFRIKGATTSFFSGKRNAKANAALKQGFIAFLQQDWSRAEQLLSASGDKGELIESKRLYAAVAADAMGDEDKAFEHLTTLEAADTDTALIKAQLLVKQQALAEAEVILQPLFKRLPKNNAVLASYVKLLEAQQDWSGLLALLPRVSKQALFDEAQQDAFSQRVVTQALMAKNETVEAVEALFKSLPGKLRKNQAIIAAYIGVLASTGHTEQAETLLLKALKKSPVDDFLPLFRQQCLRHCVKLKAYLQGQLMKDESNPQLLCALGYLAAASDDPSLAGKAYGKVSQSHPELVDLWLLADVYQRIGDKDSAIAVYQGLRS